MSATTDWIIASASIAAATGTVGTLYASVVTLRRQIDDDRRRQASGVSVDVVQLGHSVGLRVRNDSSGTVYELVGWVFVDDRRGPTEDQPQQLPRGEQAILDFGVTAHVLALVGKSDPSARFEIVFTDEAGHRWIRRPDGTLNYLHRRELSLTDKIRGRYGDWRMERSVAKR